MKVLPQSFIVPKEECLSSTNRATQRRSKLIALERRRRALIKIIRSVQRAVSQKLIRASVKIIGSRLRDNRDLPARPLPILRTIRVAQNVELPHRFHPKQLLAGSPGLHVVLRRPGKFHTVQQKYILLWTISRHRKVVAGSRIGDPDSTSFFRREVHNPGIQRK